MESKMFMICLFAFACVIQSSFALKCFTCESLSNPKCNDLSDKTYQPQDCVAESILSQGVGFLGQLGLGNTNNVNKDSIAPVCMKVVTRNTTQGQVVARRCSVKYQNQDPCEMARSAFQQGGVNVNSQLEFCGVCNDKDGCNSGNSMKLFYTLVVFGAMVSTARIFV